MSGNSILVVEDDIAFSQLIENILVRAGYSTRVAGSCEDGLSLALSLTPALLILDICLPDGSGWSLLENIRDALPMQMIPVLAMSSKRVSRVTIKEHKADRFLSKPFDMRFFMETVQDLLPLAKERKNV